MKTTIKQKIASIAAFMLVFILSASKINAQVNPYVVNNTLGCTVSIQWDMWLAGGVCDSGTANIPPNTSITIASTCPAGPVSDVVITVWDVNGATTGGVSVDATNTTNTGMAPTATPLSCAAGFNMTWFSNVTKIF